MAIRNELLSCLVVLAILFFSLFAVTEQG